MSKTIELLLAQELTAVKTFIGLLTEEHELLKQGVADGLQALSERKLALVGQLNALESQRDTLLGPGQQTSPSERMQAWLQSHPQASNIHANWSSLLELAREARRLHQMNGEILSILLNRTSEAIQILTQQQKEVSLYGSDGQASSPTGSRIVDSA